MKSFKINNFKEKSIKVCMIIILFRTKIKLFGAKFRKIS